MNNKIKLIKVIHVAKRELGMDDDTYRAFLGSIPELEGATSSANLSIPKLKAVLEAMKKLGFKVRPNNKTKGKPHNFDHSAMPVMITKIEALLADMGLPWAYADSIANQMFGIERCAWIRTEKQLKAIIAALDNEHKKQCLKVGCEELMAALCESDRKQVIAQLPDKWDRNIRFMQSLIVYLQSRGV